MIEGGFGTGAVIRKSTYRPGNAWLYLRNSPSGPIKGVLEMDNDTASALIDELQKYVDGIL